MLTAPSTPIGTARRGPQPPPLRNDASANILNGTLYSGEVFYSNYYKAFLIVYFGATSGAFGSVDNTFYIRYALGDGVKSGYSDQVKLYATQPGSPFNYAGHSYPSFDPSGKTLLLSWSYNGAYNRQALVTFS